MDLMINGQNYTIPNDQESRMLIWVLRDELALTGTKYGCGAGICGSCCLLYTSDAADECVNV